MLEEIHTKLNILRENIKEAKVDFADFIKSDAPLEERWGLFEEFGYIFGENKRFIEHFNVEQKLAYQEIAWYEDFSQDRHSTVIMKDIIDRIYEYMNPDSPEGDWTEELLIEFKEEILSKNLYSFVYDW